jgi:hypothetical protein
MPNAQRHLAMCNFGFHRARVSAICNQPDVPFAQLLFPTIRRHRDDVAESMRKGIVASAEQHFAEDGYREGRLPYAL